MYKYTLFVSWKFIKLKFPCQIFIDLSLWARWGLSCHVDKAFNSERITPAKSWFEEKWDLVLIFHFSTNLYWGLWESFLVLGLGASIKRIRPSADLEQPANHHLESSGHMPDPVPSVLYTVSLLMIRIMLTCKYCYPHFPFKEIGTQRSWETCQEFTSNKWRS